jgi:hypothetical protein
MCEEREDNKTDLGTEANSMIPRKVPAMFTTGKWLSSFHECENYGLRAVALWPAETVRMCQTNKWHRQRKYYT